MDVEVFLATCDKAITTLERHTQKCGDQYYAGLAKGIRVARQAANGQPEALQDLAALYSVTEGD